MHPWAVRRRREADLDGLARVLRAVHDRDGYPHRWPADPRAWLTPADLVDAWTVHDPAGPVGHVVLTAVRGGEATSDAWSAATQTGAAGLVCVSRLFVAPHARGDGAGAALLGAAESAAAARGRRAVLEVAETDRAALRLYARRGWRDVGGLGKDWMPAGTVARLLVAPPPAGA